MYFLISGASGTGKTTIARWINLQGVPICAYDLDDYFIGEPRNQAWRLRAYEAFFRNCSEHGDNGILLGQIPILEFLKCSHIQLNIHRLAIAILTLDDTCRENRLLARGWSRERIELHRTWLVENELAKTTIFSNLGVAILKVIDVTDCSTDIIGSQLVSWIEFICSEFNYLHIEGI